VYDFAPIFPLLESLLMSALTASEIANIARLARLSLRHDEVPAYIDSLSRIIGLVGELERAETAGVEPMSHPLPGQSARLRTDEVTETDQHTLFQQNAPQVEAALYLVPRVIE
jgi:aspartyl-tRNA(Asn)/glutamyl-tRNA(Gln) amidotransferase subunit C